MTQIAQEYVEQTNSEIRANYATNEDVYNRDGYSDYDDGSSPAYCDGGYFDQ